MTQHTFILPINGASSGIEFEEKSYKLEADEVLIGRHEDFPEKKNIGSILTQFDGIVTSHEENQLITPSSDLLISLNDLVNSYGLRQGEETWDKGLSLEFDLFFWLNHLYENRLTGMYHLSLSANIKCRVTVFKDAGQAVYSGGLNIISQNGYYVEYDSDETIYGDIKDDGELDFDNDPPPLLISLFDTPEPGTPGTFLKIGNNLQNYSPFNSNPIYELYCSYKVKGYEYSRDDYTYESV
jgi:hypothetical protein